MKKSVPLITTVLQQALTLCDDNPGAVMTLSLTRNDRSLPSDNQSVARALLVAVRRAGSPEAAVARHAGGRRHAQVGGHVGGRTEPLDLTAAPTRPPAQGREGWPVHGRGAGVGEPVQPQPLLAQRCRSHGLAGGLELQAHRHHGPCGGGPPGPRLRAMA